LDLRVVQAITRVALSLCLQLDNPKKIRGAAASICPKLPCPSRSYAVCGHLVDFWFLAVEPVDRLWAMELRQMSQQPAPLPLPNRARFHSNQHFYHYTTGLASTASPYSSGEPDRVSTVV
jgi:hypothetical protein